MPLAPRSLQPDEVRAEHVKLSWQPPLDDGGTPITNYLVRYMDIDTGEWVTACTVSRRETIFLKGAIQADYTVVTHRLGRKKIID